MADCCAQKKSRWRPLALFVYVIVNVRVEAGVATAFERALDGLVGAAALLVLLYVSARFFKVIEEADNDDPLACCCGTPKK